MTERRRFSKRQKDVLYVAADGCCVECGVPLETGWHGDHRDPHSAGGPTDIDNGGALCPACNLRKGNRVHFTDAFRPRPFQREVINSVLDGMASGRRVTVVLASPGSGKTLAYQAAATYGYREGRIDLVAVFVPRIILAQQCETTWLYRRPDGGFAGHHELFDAHSRVGRIQHVPNTPPLTPPGQTGLGFVTTYSALCTATLIFQDWAQRNRGRFLLIADEAQFCGASNDDRSGGTRAGSLITELSELAAHTLLLTGTPYRSDGQRLVLAEYDDPDSDGRRQLLRHAEATYRTGVTEGYLRRFEATLHEARVRWKAMDNTVTEYDLSANGADLADVLRKPHVWQPVVDGVVAGVREKQRVCSEYRGLISCMEQRDAAAVYEYVKRGHPDVTVLKATTEDGAGAEAALRQFKTAEGGDILVTVRKAFIGYDCPQITVVGILTHYRDWGHLEQLVGRGLRMWSGQPGRIQSCRVIAPDDPAMTAFIDYMRGESEQGLRERERRELEGDRANPRDDELGYVESAHATTARVVSNDAELDNDQRILIESVKHEVGSAEDVTVLARFAELLGLSLPATTPVPQQATAAADEAPMTEREQIKAVNDQVEDEIRDVLAAQGILGGRPDYGDHAQRLTRLINQDAGYRAGDCRTVEDAKARLTAAWNLRERVL